MAGGKKVKVRSHVKVKKITDKTVKVTRVDPYTRRPPKVETKE